MSTNNSLITIGNLNGDFIVKDGNVGLNPEIKGEKGDKGDKGDKGERGDGLQIDVTFVSVAEMEAVVAEYPEGTVAMISTPDTNDVDNSKIYVKRIDVWGFINDLSGAVGLQGPAGEKGADGTPGEPGAAGQDGAPGKDGVNGVDGTNGKSAYEIWLSLGHTGSEQDFINSLKGEPGAPGTGTEGDTVTYPLIAQTDIAGNYLGSMIDAQGVAEIVAPLTGFSGGSVAASRAVDLFSEFTKDYTDEDLDKVLFVITVKTLVGNFEINNVDFDPVAWSSNFREMWLTKNLTEKRVIADYYVTTRSNFNFYLYLTQGNDLGVITVMTLNEFVSNLNSNLNQTSYLNSSLSQASLARQVLIDYGIEIDAPVVSEPPVAEL